MREKKSHKPQRLPPLHSLQVFTVAAKHQSFVLAANELCVTHGAVSRQIRGLEEELGITLFERRNRAVFLTAHGKTLFESCTLALSALATTIEQIRASTEASPLVLSCEPTIAMRWLIPRLAEFRALHPTLRIHLLTAGCKLDFARDKIDLALRRNDFIYVDSCFSERIAPEMMGPVCAPDLVAACTTGAGKLRQLHTRSRPGAWAQWMQRMQTTSSPMQFSEQEFFEHFYLSLQAASAGLGLAMGSIYMVGDDIRDQRMRAPHGFVEDGSDYVLLSPTAFAQDERRLLFLDWLRQEMHKTSKLAHF